MIPPRGEQLQLTEDLPGDLKCDDVFVGDETVEIKGHIKGESIDLKRSRVNSCESFQYQLWESISGL